LNNKIPLGSEILLTRNVANTFGYISTYLQMFWPFMNIVKMLRT